MRWHEVCWRYTGPATGPANGDRRGLLSAELAGGAAAEVGFADADFEHFIDETLQSIDAMVFGRVAFQKLAQYWPGASPPEASEVQGRLMHELPKYVVSDRLEQADWNNSHISAATSPRQ